MASKRKICAITANRADFSRMETALRAIDRHPDLELQLVVMGSHLMQHTGQTIDEIHRKGFRVHHTIHMEISGSIPATMSKSVGLAIIELSTILNHWKPDLVVVPVDRFESLAMGTAASLMNIPIAHIQGGEVTGTIDESIRHALTKLSHIHFPATEQSRQRIIKMGEPAELVFNVGCPGTDLILEVPALDSRQTIELINREVLKATEPLNPSKPFLFIVQHPVTTEFGDSTAQITETMEALKDFDEQIIILWPNIDAGADDISRVLRKHFLFSPNGNNLKVFKHLSTEVFVNVLRNALCQVGNSSSGIREACYFGTPVVNVGSRQMGRERGQNVVDALYDRREIAKAIKSQVNHGKYSIEQIYGDGTAGKKIAQILATIKLPNVQKRITY